MRGIPLTISGVRDLAYEEDYAGLARSYSRDQLPEEVRTYIIKILKEKTYVPESWLSSKHMNSDMLYLFLKSNFYKKLTEHDMRDALCNFLSEIGETEGFTFYAVNNTLMLNHDFDIIDPKNNEFASQIKVIEPSLRSIVLGQDKYLMELNVSDQKNSLINMQIIIDEESVSSCTGVCVERFIGDEESGIHGYLVDQGLMKRVGS